MQNFKILADLLLGYFWLVKKERKKEEDQGEINGIGLGWSLVRFKAKADQKVWKRWKEELSAAEDGNLRSETKSKQE